MKILVVLYDDPLDGYPTSYARDSIPKIEHYPDGQKGPTPHAIDFVPGELLGSISGELGLRKFLENLGHSLIVIPFMKNNFWPNCVSSAIIFFLHSSLGHRQ